MSCKHPNRPELSRLCQSVRMLDEDEGGGEVWLKPCSVVLRFKQQREWETTGNGTGAHRSPDGRQAQNMVSAVPFADHTISTSASSHPEGYAAAAAAVRQRKGVRRQGKASKHQRACILAFFFSFAFCPAMARYKPCGAIDK
ncbi:hypothetical protein LZ31DRAFT_2382 [Colletotrichum somersetense]|nr:hypothetical protein LZ31DRAFT_2382 [Colletotrichum somersetense]